MLLDVCVWPKNKHLSLIRLHIDLIYFILAWVLKNENVQCVLLGASTVDQLYLNIQALQVYLRLNIDTFNKGRYQVNGLLYLLILKSVV